MQCIIASQDAVNSDDGPEFTRWERIVAQRFIDELPQPDKAMLLARQAGQSPRQISAELGVDFTHVCKTLARVYADLRVKLDD